MHGDPTHPTAANDASPLFPDVLAMSSEEFSDYEPPPERLAFYPLDSEDAVKAFLHDVYWIGYPGLFIAVNHVWKLLYEPRAYRCTLMGQHSGAGGAGRTALVNTLRQFIGEAIATIMPIPSYRDFDTLDDWNDQIALDRISEEKALDEVIARYALILGGSPGHQPDVTGRLVFGPWTSRD